MGAEIVIFLVIQPPAYVVSSKVKLFTLLSRHQKVHWTNAAKGGVEIAIVFGNPATHLRLIVSGHKATS